MGGLDRIINPIPKNEKLKEAIFCLLDNLLAEYHLKTTGDGEPLEESFEKLKKEVEKYEMKIITKGGEYTINLKKYVEEKGPEGILKQAINLSRPYNIMQQRYKNYGFIRFVIYEEKYLDRLLEEINKKYELEDEGIIGFMIVVRY